MKITPSIITFENDFPVIKTDRLVLRKLKLEDGVELFNYRSNKKNFPFVAMPEYTSVSQAHDYIEKMNNGIHDKKWLIWAICIKDSNQILGTISLWNFQHNDRKSEFGYGLFPQNRGLGYMEESLRAVIEYGFTKLSLLSVEAYTSLKNKPSIALLSKCGFEYVDNIIEDGHTLGIHRLYNS